VRKEGEDGPSSKANKALQTEIESIIKEIAETPTTLREEAIKSHKAFQPK
jgi:hypothetical protein